MSNHAQVAAQSHTAVIDVAPSAAGPAMSFTALGHCVASEGRLLLFDAASNKKAMQLSDLQPR
jgi:hypothetical protein